MVELRKSDSAELLPAIHRSLQLPGRHVKTHSLTCSSTSKGLRRHVKSELPPTSYGMRNYVFRCVFRTHKGKAEGLPRRVNQDSHIIQSQLTGIIGAYFFAVCDGHGPNGHLISLFLKKKLPKLLEREMPGGTCSETELALALETAIAQTSKELLRSSIDISVSGSTLTCVLVFGKLLVTANVGDSRAILVRNNSPSVIDLTQDHKPDLPLERERIINRGGRVMPAIDRYGRPCGVKRVWLRNRNVPGLAMSRAIGDTLAASVGVINTPEVTCYQAKKYDRFVILATDGLWEIVTSDEAAQIVNRALIMGKSELSCNFLVNEALNRWNTVGNCADDITVIVFFLSIR